MGNREINDQIFVDNAYKEWCRMSRRQKSEAGGSFQDYVALLIKAKDGTGRVPIRPNGH